MTKKIQLLEKDKGQIIKNESYGIRELKNIVLQRNQAHFKNWLNGNSRRATLDLVFKTFSELIDLDQPGNNKVPR
jgi:ribosomal protein S6